MRHSTESRLPLYGIAQSLDFALCYSALCYSTLYRYRMGRSRFGIARSQYTILSESDFINEYFRKYEFIFETALAQETWDPGVLRVENLENLKEIIIITIMTLIYYLRYTDCWSTGWGSETPPDSNLPLFFSDVLRWVSDVIVKKCIEKKIIFTLFTFLLFTIYESSWQILCFTM
jgi:hypothetical protein